MGIWISRIWREAIVLAAAIITALFGANDALDVVTWRAIDRWGFFIAFVAFGLLVMWRLLRLQERLDNRKRFRLALDLLTPSIDEAQAIIDECGRPREDMVGAPPTYFMDHCLPRIGGWASKVLGDIESEVPEYRGKFQYFGNVTHGTHTKAASVQALEQRLKQLVEIIDDLRRRTFDV